MKYFRGFLLIGFVIFSLTACQKEQKKDSLENNLLNATVWFQHSAEQEACYLQAYSLAKNVLFANLQMTDNDMPKAIILDIDETVLDNSPLEAYLIKNNIPYSSEIWDKWVALEKARALPGVHDFLNFAKDSGIEVFYISNRRVKSLQHTINNLQKEGLPFADSMHVLLKDTTSDKTPRRKIVTEKYDVLLYIGDNLRDFSEDFKDRSQKDGKLAVDDNKNLFGKKYIILPNPMYGEWLSQYKGESEEEQTKKMIESLNAF